MALKRTCCGLSVRAASLIIGYVSLILSCLGFKICIFMVILGRGDPSLEHSEGFIDVKTKVLLIAALFSLQVLIASVLMVYGIHKTKPEFVLLWLVGFGAWITLQPFILLAILMSWSSVYSFEMLLLLLIGVVAINVNEIYLITVVSSHYHNMKKATLLFDEEEEEMLMSHNHWTTWCSIPRNIKR